MFKSLDLSLIVEFMLMFYKDKPIDWLLDHIMWVKVCNPEKDAVSLRLIGSGGSLSCFSCCSCRFFCGLTCWCLHLLPTETL